MDITFAIDAAVQSATVAAEKRCQPVFDAINQTSEANTQKVLSAFIRHKVASYHLSGSTGYGYNDIGRETLEAVFADITGCEAALYRHQFMSGTHALTVALFGLLRPGDLLLCGSGVPYDTIHTLLGLNRKTGEGSLPEYGIGVKVVPLAADGTPDLPALLSAIHTMRPKVLYLQRSRGYTLRPSLTVEQLGQIAAAAKKADPSIRVVVDNCYGEFVEQREPTDVGADLIVGSLIKNPGGGIAKTGGYIAGSAPLVKACANRLTAPGVGGEIGATLSELRDLFLGLYLAPHVVEEALKSAVFAASLLDLLGYPADPGYDQPRTDIIQSLRLGTPDKLIAFCQGIQAGSPVDSFAAPEPAPMPGYDHPVIMAAGSFTQGSSIELSADAPLRDPFAVFLQGGVNYHASKLAICLAASKVLSIS